MGKEDVVYIYKQMCVSSMLRLLNKFENEKKKTKTCHLQQHGWTFRALC